MSPALTSFGAALAILALGGTALAEGPECFPECRTGYICQQGSCVSACNPPCGSNERCTAAATCEPKPAAAPLPPPPQASPAPSSLPPSAAPPAEAPPPWSTTPSRPAVHKVPLFFDSPSGDYDVTVNGGDAHCRAPCTVQVAPGPAVVVVSGDASIRADIVVPDGPSKYEIHKRRKGQAVTGGVLVGVGMAITVVVMINNQKEDATAAESEANLGLALVGLGVTLTGAILYWTSGHDKLEMEDAKLERRAPAFGLWAKPALGGGAIGGAALRF
ncbi:MAG TPA: hypothetical protein VHB79_00620 [Polyangiaceae bacterium]|nr:hypothetical protein [Polyangiaceae bacterium]